MTSKTEKQINLRRKIAGLEADLNGTIERLISAKLELRLMQEVETEPPVPRRRAAVTSMTRREMVARVLRDLSPHDGLTLQGIQESVNRNYSEQIDKATLSTMLNRLKHGGYIYRTRAGIWHWAPDAISASTSLKG